MSAKIKGDFAGFFVEITGVLWKLGMGRVICEGMVLD
jgi:hypothetical protein